MHSGVLRFCFIVLSRLYSLAFLSDAVGYWSFVVVASQEHHFALHFSTISLNSLVKVDELNLKSEAVAIQNREIVELRVLLLLRIQDA